MKHHRSHGGASWIGGIEDLLYCRCMAQPPVPDVHEVVPENEPVRSTKLAGLLTVTLTPGLNALPVEFKASDTKTYEPLGIVAVFQLHSQP